jgi:hypothetical protein
MKVVIQLVGDGIREPVKFRIQLEYRARVGATTGTVQWDHPVVEDTDVALERTPEREYTGTVTPTRPGLLRVGVVASGETEMGKAFSGQYISSIVVVNRRPGGPR